MSKSLMLPDSPTQRPRAPWIGPLFLAAVAVWVITFAFIFT